MTEGNVDVINVNKLAKNYQTKSDQKHFSSLFPQNDLNCCFYIFFALIITIILL